jgi:riboflavin kinase/FMN adenylyltransferase
MKILADFWGKVKVGKSRGKLLGFPTANITLHKKIPEGVYASCVFIDDQRFMAATFIGSSKTFNENDYKAESHILKFNRNIYRKWIRVKLYKKLRGNIKFASVNELTDQIKQDIIATKKYFLI